jgi:RimJ/RimL family protein N-acetyltransferase
VIETERLFLRRPTAADVEDPPPFLTDPRVMDSSAASRTIRTAHRAELGGRLGRSTRREVHRRDGSGRAIGRVGLNFYDPVAGPRSNLPDARPELTWALAYEHLG